MRSDRTNTPPPRIPQPDCQTAFPHAIGLCAISFEGCVYQLLELFEIMQTYWEDSRRRGEPLLHPACQEFMSTAKDSLRHAAAIGRYRRSEWPGVVCNDDLVAQQASQFIDAVDQVIATRNQWKDGDVELAINTLKLASSLVGEIPWGQLPETALVQNQDVLERFLKKVGSKRKCLNDKYWNNLVRRALRAEIELATVRAKGGR